MADVVDEGGAGQKEANKAPSPKPDTEDAGDIAPPLITKENTEVTAGT